MSNLSERIKSIVLVGTLTGTMIGFTGCSKKESNDSAKEEVSSALNSKDSIVAPVDDVNNNSPEVSIDGVINDLKSLGLNINDEMLNNAAIMLSLDLFTKKDENGKLNSNAISKYKDEIDVNNMMTDFNSFLDILQQYIIKNYTVYNISLTLSDSQKIDKEILGGLESILNNVISYQVSNNKDKIVDEFNRIYATFVGGKDLTIGGKKYKLSDLSYTARAVANTYAEAVAYFAKDYIKADEYKKIDAALDDQNNKGYIRERLAILANDLPNKTDQKDLTNEFNDLYAAAIELIKPRIKTSDQTVKDMVNYLNMKYLGSLDPIFDGYSDERLDNAIELIQAITEYNIKNSSEMILLSDLLLPKYAETNTGKVDAVALDFVQFNSAALIDDPKSDITEITDLISFQNNPYSGNLFAYFTKQDFEYSYKENKKTSVKYQEISNGANLANEAIILHIIDKLTKVNNINNYREKVKMNLLEAVKQIQLITKGECETGEYQIFFEYNTGTDGTVIIKK